MIHTQTEIDNLVELAIIQRAELKRLVESLPQLREHLSSEIERNLEEIEPAIRSELEQFVAARASDAHAQTSAALTAKIDELARSLETTTAARYSVLMVEREKNERFAQLAEQKIAAAAAELPTNVKSIVLDELSRFPRANQIDQLRKEFAEPASLNPRGKWQIGETYNKLDLVSINGNSFIANETTSEKPTMNSTAWTLNSSKGGVGAGITSITELTGTPSNGETLIGNGQDYVKATLTAGNGISITNGAGSITVTATGGVAFQGSWNASTNTPTLTSSVGTTGFFYIVSVAGSTNLNGVTDWEIGDWAIFGTSTWTKVDNTDKVSSVFGRVGSVVGVSTDYSAVGITNTAIGASNPSTVAATTLSSNSTTTLNGTTIPANKTLVVTTDKLSALAATTSAELAGVISDETGSGALVFATSPTLVTPALGTPSALVGTNITGTAAGLTAGNVSTNANLTGVITSVGNATSINSQTGTGSKFVVDTSPTLVTPNLGTPSAVVLTNASGTAASLTAGNVTTNANLTGDVTSVGNATSIAAGVIVNADISASAAIVDTKLDTIATALKVSNSATTAASANTASAIVARDASGNFSAGTISAALTGNAATATALATGRTIAITGDLAYTSPSFDGSGNVTAAGTLASVASAGTSGGSTAIPIVTINAKGLTTSITTAVVIAPASTLTGATLASGVTASSLTSLGTIASLAVTAGTISTTPSASTDIANKLYVDTVAQGLDAKASCVAATTANITLSGTQTIDGISVIAADRVLVKNQTLSQNNGIYLCAAGAWTRTTDADTWDELTSAFTFIETGTVNADTGYVCTANAGGTLGTTALPWSQFSGAGSYTASTGLTLTGTAFSLTAPVTVALGGTNATSAGIAAFNNISGFTAAGATGTTSTNLVFSTSPTLVTPNIGVATGTSLAAALNGTLGATTPSSVAATTGTFSSTLGVTGVATLGNGAILGTPASGTVTNLTGTASININGTVGATTPAAGSFTTISATGAITQTQLAPTISISSNATGKAQGYFNTNSGANGLSIGSEGSAGNALAAGAAAYGGVVTTVTNHPVYIGVNGTVVGTFTSTGLNSTVIGATTPAAGSFTTLSATSTITGTGITASAALRATGAVPSNPTSTSVYDYFSNTSRFFSFGDVSTEGQFLWYTALGAVGGTQRMNLTSTGLAVTGTLSATGNTNFGGGTAYSNGMTIKPASNDYTLTLLQSNVNTAGWGMYADTGGGFSLTRYGSGVYGTAAFTVALGGGISMTNGLAVTGTVTTTKDNGGITLNNATSGNAEIYFQAGGTNKVRIGLAGGSTPTGLRIYSDMGGAEYATFSSTGLAVTGLISVAGAGSNIVYSGAGDGLFIKNSSDTSGTAFIEFLKASNGVIGSITRVSTTDAVVYNTTSDARLKENFRDFTDSGRLIDALKPRVFDWKDSDGNGKDVIGFVAQEEHAADPIFAHIGAVSVGDDDPTTITKQWQRSDAALIPILVAELQSLRKRLAALESK